MQVFLQCRYMYVAFCVSCANYGHPQTYPTHVTIFASTNIIMCSRYVYYRVVLVQVLWLNIRPTCD